MHRYVVSYDTAYDKGVWYQLYKTDAQAREDIETHLVDLHRTDRDGNALNPEDDPGEELWTKTDFNQFSQPMGFQDIDEATWQIHKVGED